MFNLLLETNYIQKYFHIFLDLYEYLDENLKSPQYCQAPGLGLDQPGPGHGQPGLQMAKPNLGQPSQQPDRT